MKVESCTKPQHFCCVSERPDAGSLRSSVRPEPTMGPVNVTIGEMFGKQSAVLNMRGLIL